MEKMFGPAYQGDPGVPHSDKEGFATIFWGAVTFSVYSWACPYYWEQGNNAMNWHDWAMVCENNQRKRAQRKNKTYRSKWNELPVEVRESYYHNWADYFP